MGCGEPGAVAYLKIGGSFFDRLWQISRVFCDFF